MLRSPPVSASHPQNHGFGWDHKSESSTRSRAPRGRIGCGQVTPFRMPLCTFSWHSSKKRCNAWTATWDRFPSGSLEKTWPRLFMVDVSWCCGWLRNPALACRWFIPLSFRYVQCFIGLPIVTSCVHLEQLNFQEFSGAETFLTFWLANAPQAPQPRAIFDVLSTDSLRLFPLLLHLSISRKFDF